MARTPLAGIRVADFTWVWAGPYCTLQLAHLGADVIRIESATRPCVTRLLPPWPGGVPGGLDRSGYYNQYNQGKRSVTLNLKVPEAVAIARRLAAASDIVAENFAPGVMDGLKLGYEDLKALKPDIIMISLSGYGATGPQRDYVAYGPALVPLSGLSTLTGYPGGPPGEAGFSYADPNAGIHGAFAVLAALYHRALTGEGQFIDLSQWECATRLAAEGIIDHLMNRREPARLGNRDPGMAPHGVFRCLDLPERIFGHVVDRFVAVAVADDPEWRRLAQAIGRPELADDPRFATFAARKRNENELEAIIGAWGATRSAETAAAVLQEAGVAAAPCADNRQLAEDPHLSERGFFVELDHPEVGRRKHAGIPWRMSATPCAVRAPAPLIGQHTREVLSGVLGLSAAEIARLSELGALA